MKNAITVSSGMVLDEDTCLNLARLCRICNVNANLIGDMIDEGLIVPRGDTPENWVFGAGEVWRVQTAIRLQRDLRVNIPGAALVLDLLEEVEELRRRLR